MVKSRQLGGGNAEAFMPMFPADILDFLVTDINTFLEEEIISGNLSTGTNLVISLI